MRVLINRRAVLSSDKFRKNRRGTERLIKEVSCFLLVCLCLVLAGVAVRNARQSPSLRNFGGNLGGDAAQAQVQHILVVDCGSTGTRINIIRREEGGSEPRFTAVNWQDFGVSFGGEDLAAAPKKQHGYNRVETLPGIHQQDGKGLEGVKEALEPLLEWADRAIPRGGGGSGGFASHEDIPIFLFATAGVRKLASEQQDALMSHVRQVLSGSAFRFEPHWAKIIAGEDEGIFSWVSANYKLGNLGVGSKDQDQVQAMNMLELGGSSLQVSYVMDSPDPNEKATREVKALGKTYYLQVESFNGYGMNDAFASSCLAADNSNTTTSLTNSNSSGGGDAEKEKEREEEETASAAAVVRHPCLQKDFTYRGESNNVSYEGDFDMEECRGVIHKAAEGNAVQKYQDQLGSKNLGNFIALAGFFLVYSFFEIALDVPVSQMSKQVEDLCGRDFGGLNEEEKEDKNAGLYCFRFAYTRVILSDWLGLADDQVHISSHNEWALGAAILLQEEILPSLMSSSSGGGLLRVGGVNGYPSFVVMSPLVAGLACVLCLALVLVLWRRRKQQQLGGLKRSASGLLPIWTKANFDGSAASKFP